MKKLSLLLACAIIGAACATTPSTSPSCPTPNGVPRSPARVFGDASEVPVETMPTRIVSLSPSATEMLFAIGAGDQVVAVDEFSDYPPEAPTTDLSGYTPNLEAIADLNPDLVVFATETGSLSQDLSNLGISAIQQDAPADFEGIYTQIEELGAATGHVAAAAALVAEMRNDLVAVKAELPEGTEGLTYFHELDQTYYTVTSATFIGVVYAEFGLVNIADGAEGSAGNAYPQLSEEYILEQDPALVFLADSGLGDPPVTLDSVASRPGWEKSAAVTGCGVIVVDEDLASRWGPRIIDFMREVAAALTSRQQAAAIGAA